MTALWGLLIPFIGTSAGAACVFLLKDELKPGVQKLLLGFASGVMVAASVWSLLIPAMNMSEPMGKWAFIPAAVGLLLGMAFLLVLDKTIPHLHLGSDTPQGPKKKLDRSTMLLLAVTLHNIPEGKAVGGVFAGVISGSSEMTIAGAIALAVGIAIQNFPEGAVISLPLKSETGMKSGKAFIYGVLSGIVEPVAALATVLISNLITPILPYVLAFAAGSMLYVVVEELIPEASEGDHSNIGTIAFAIGFVLMMVLDVALG